MNTDNGNAAARGEYSRTNICFMIFALFACVIIGGFGSFKFIPMQTAIQDYFQVGESAYGYLNTSAGWISVFCAIPMGFLVRKLPCNWSVLIGYTVAILGILVQTASKSFVLFVIGRMIEGTGTGLTGLVTGSLILNLVSPKRIAFWSSMMIMASVLPQVIMAKGGTALMLNSGLSFQTIFRIIGAAYIVAVIVWLICVPFSLKIHGVGSAQKPTREQTLRVIKNKSTLLVAIANIFFTGASITFSAYIIRFLTTKGIPQASAASIYSYTTMLGLVSMIVFGLLSDRLKTRRKIAMMSYVAGAVAFVALALLPGNLILIYVFLWGTLPRSIAGLTSASSADIAEIPADIPIVNSVKNTISHVGSILIGILMGYIIQYFGYQIAIFFLAGGMLVGAVCWYFAKKIP